MKEEQAGVKTTVQYGALEFDWLVTSSSFSFKTDTFCLLPPSERKCYYINITTVPGFFKSIFSRMVVFESI